MTVLVIELGLLHMKGARLIVTIMSAIIFVCLHLIILRMGTNFLHECLKDKSHDVKITVSLKKIVIDAKQAHKK